MSTPEQLRAVVVFFVVLPFIDAILLVLFLSDGMWERHPVAIIALVLVLLGSALGLILYAWEPFRRAELREHAGKAISLRSRDVQKELLGLAVAVLLLPPIPLHYILDEPWSHAFGRSAAILAYFLVFIPLGRLQRCGTAPYWRPAWYGFVLAGLAGALVWSVLTGSQFSNGAVHGIVWAFLHYVYVRWATRGAKVAAQQSAPGDEGRGTFPAGS